MDSLSLPSLPTPLLPFMVQFASDCHYFRSPHLSSFAPGRRAMWTAASQRQKCTLENKWRIKILMFWSKSHHKCNREMQGENESIKQTKIKNKLKLMQKLRIWNNFQYEIMKLIRIQAEGAMLTAGWPTMSTFVVSIWTAPPGNWQLDHTHQLQTNWALL